MIRLSIALRQECYVAFAAIAHKQKLSPEMCAGLVIEAAISHPEIVQEINAIRAREDFPRLLCEAVAASKS